MGRVTQAAGAPAIVSSSIARITIMTQSAPPAEAVELDARDLPAYCPNPKMTLWNQHPRVFLDVTKEGQARCPYCSTLYRLKPGVKIGHGH